MSQGEDGFLARWSRRKAASRDAADPALAPMQPEGTLENGEAAVPELPPLDSLGADSDYTVFLARGVSRAVQAQALRVAWASDPAIANFRGMAEYAWDFNAPGYGELAAGDDAAAWLSQIVRSGAKLVAAVEPVAVAPAEAASPALLVEAAFPAPALAVDVASMSVRVPAAVAIPLPLDTVPQPAVSHAADELPGDEPDVASLPPRRRHGGAMPV